MKRLLIFIALITALAVAVDTLARGVGGGGGGRVGGGGGGGARVGGGGGFCGGGRTPSFGGGGMARPSYSRPAQSARPSFVPQQSRPSFAQQRPAVIGRIISLPAGDREFPPARGP